MCVSPIATATFLLGLSKNNDKKNDEFLSQSYLSILTTFPFCLEDLRTKEKSMKLLAGSIVTIIMRIGQESAKQKVEYR